MKGLSNLANSLSGNGSTLAANERITSKIAPEPVYRRADPKSWITIYTILHALLLVPYVTNLVTHYYAIGLFPIRPVFYMLLVGGSALLWSFLNGVDFTKTALVFLGLLAIRLFDAAALKRYITPDDHGSAVTGLGAALFVALVIFANLGVFYRRDRKPILVVSGMSILVVTLSIYYEWFGFAEYSNVPGRPSGHLGDPNNACIVLTLMLGVFLSVNRTFWVNMGVIAITAAGVLPTVSRSGFLVLVAIIAAFVVLNIRQYFFRFVVVGIAAIPVMVLAVGMLMTKSTEGGKKDSNVNSRISAMFGGDVSAMNSNDRMVDLRDGWEAIQEKPMLGFGTMAGTDFYQPHNQVLTVWIDLGIFGALVYVFIIGVLGVKSVFSGFRAIYAVIPVVLFIPFSQILLVNYAYFYAIGIVLFSTTTQFWRVDLLRGKLS